MKTIILLLLLACGANAQSTLYQYLTMGKYPVGFQTFYEYDASRPAVREQKEQTKGRFLQINIWYPATKKEGKVLTFKDFVDLSGKELDENSATNEQATLKAYLDWNGIADTARQDFITYLEKNQSLYTRLNAPVKAGNFPVVLLMHGSAATYAFMGAYLASQGYFVVQVPVKGTAAYELDYQLEAKGLETQIIDYEYAINFIKQRFPYLDYNQVAVAGLSFGGQSAVGLAIRHANIKAVISLDGGIGSDFGGTLLSRQSFYDINKIKAPILHLYNPNDPYTDLQWLKKYNAAHRTLVAFNNVEHQHFSAFGLLQKEISNDVTAKALQTSTAYEAILWYTQTFLDQHLKNKSNKMMQLSKKAWVKSAVHSFNRL
ncbi:MAG: dienelactone hydrolase family protein [Saprospiraceae bacterium]